MFAKLTQKEFVQKILIEIVCDSTMLVGGLVIGYYIKILLS
ncbi:hypothetical protein ACFCP7_24595 [Paenibacillus elgii]